MGKYYALAEKIDPEIAAAIEEHYRPQGPSDRVPTAPVSIAVALADKIDTLVGFWAIDEKPTGSKDPYALRRAALGVIRLIIDNKLRMSLLGLFAKARKNFGAAQDLLTFFADRLKVHLREQGARHDLVDAVFALPGQDDLLMIVRRVEVLGKFLDTDDGKNLLVGYRRAANILRDEEKKDKKSYAGEPDTKLLKEPQEKAPAEAIGQTETEVVTAVKTGDFEAAQHALSKLRTPVDQFFDKVTVNADDPR